MRVGEPAVVRVPPKLSRCTLNDVEECSSSTASFRSGQISGLSALRLTESHPPSATRKVGGRSGEALRNLLQNFRAGGAWIFGAGDGAAKLTRDVRTIRGASPHRGRLIIQALQPDFSGTKTPPHRDAAPMSNAIASRKNPGTTRSPPKQLGVHQIDKPLRLRRKIRPPAHHHAI